MYSDRPSFCYSDESNWQNFHHYSSTSLPESIRTWLLDKGSLTKRLINASHGDFKVIVLDHKWETPRCSEARLLSMPPRQKAIVREVVLMCNNEAWVFARSVMPAKAINGRLRRLRKFSDSSLGAMLFSDSSLRRKPFEITRMQGQSKQLPVEFQTDQTLWGRRCRFELAGKAIMVSEIFLPQFKP